MCGVHVEGPNGERGVHRMSNRGNAPVKQLELSFVGRRGEASIGTLGESIAVDDGRREMEHVVERGNLFAALTRVKRNGGGPGVDGMTVEELPGYLQKHWTELRESLRSGTYRPSPVKRVEIPKPGGGVRCLGIPTVMDRFIQQAILQVLSNRDGTSPSRACTPARTGAAWRLRPPPGPGQRSPARAVLHSPYGLLPNHPFLREQLRLSPTVMGRNAHQAVVRAQGYLHEGYAWVVDIDLERFFDRVNHDKVMGLVRGGVSDRRVVTLIGRYLRSGVLTGDGFETTVEGTPQGGPLSPLLANLLLDGLDKELERRGHRFVRYADDCNIYVRSKPAGERVLASVTRYLERRLRLSVNGAKSAVDRPWRRTFLGFSFTGRRVKNRRRVSMKALKAFRHEVRRLTQRTRGDIFLPTGG